MASQQYSGQATARPPLPPLPPRAFQPAKFEVIDPAQLVEEERLPFYNRDDYYPMRIGEILKDRYQVVAKLGYGASSTVWLCRDIRYSKHPVSFTALLLNALAFYQRAVVPGDKSACPYSET